MKATTKNCSSSFAKLVSCPHAAGSFGSGKDAGENKQRKGKTLKEKRKKLKKIVGKSVTKVKVVAGAQVEKAVHKVKHNKDDGKGCLFL